MDTRSLRIWLCAFSDTLGMGGRSLRSPSNAYAGDFVVVYADDSDDSGASGRWQEFLVASRVGLCRGAILDGSGRSRELPQCQQNRRQLDARGATGYGQQPV